MGRTTIAVVCAASTVACGIAVEPAPGGLDEQGLPSNGTEEPGAIDSGYLSCDAGCPDAMACGYALDGGCDAQGVCLPTHSCAGAQKQPTYPGCLTAGVVLSCELPAGYSPAPVQGADAADVSTDECAPSGCTGSCADLAAHNVSTVSGGCVVWQCCVPPDASADADAADAGGD